MFGGTADKGESLGVSYTIKYDEGYYIRSRFGWLPHEDVLLYINVGSGSYDGKGELVNQGITTSAEISISGLEVGMGAEYLISENISIRGEYNLVDYREEFDFYVISPEISLERLGLGIAYRF